MRLPKISEIKRSTFLIAYKLLYDLLFLLLLTFAAMLVAEGALPGLVSAHISLAKLVIVIILILAGIILISHKFNLVYDKPSIKKNKLVPVLILFAFIIIGNSLLKFALWENMIITLGTIFVFLLLYELIFLEKR